MCYMEFLHERKMLIARNSIITQKGCKVVVLYNPDYITRELNTDTKPSAALRNRLDLHSAEALCSQMVLMDASNRKIDTFSCSISNFMSFLVMCTTILVIIGKIHRAIVIKLEWMLSAPGAPLRYRDIE